MRMGEELRGWLAAGRMGQILYAFDSVESTNDTAAALARAGAEEGTLVVADQQTRGRGRAGSRWETPAGAAVAMSLILRPAGRHPLRWTGLGALAVAEALEGERMAPRIKWPNDVLLGGRKVAGVLAEAAWQGEAPAYVILGIGVNLGRAAARGAFAFPATSVEEHLGRALLRPKVMAAIVEALGSRYLELASDRFLRAWESRLAYVGERVVVESGTGVLEGRLVGLGAEGEARLELDDGRVVECGGEARSLRLLRS
jgi:BirA family biotin operon repressor/biotin-[acetyl-CoA-carboxylase] ligase